MAVAALTAVAAFTAGCRASQPPAAAGVVDGFDLASTDVRSPSATTGGTLRLEIGAVDSLDPARSYSPGVWNVMRLYTRQLVTFAAAPGDAGTRIVSDLATSPGRTGDAGRTWTYTLRPGLRWADGSPLTSRDVKYGIERLFASDVLPGGPTWAVHLLDDPHAPYGGPYRDTAPGRLGLRSIGTPDDRTVVFHLAAPFADWDRVLALPASSPVAERADSGTTYALRPLSLGPYRLTGPDRHGVIVFVRNPYWSRATDPVRAALPDRVELATAVLPAERDRRLLAGGADADVTGVGLQPAAAGQVLADPALVSRADDPTTGTMRLLAMPTSIAPFDNVYCRRAAQYALDKADLKDSLGGAWSASLSTTLWPRQLPGYPASAPYPSGDGNHGDLVQARVELGRCGHPGGFDATLGTVDAGRGLVAARSVARALGRIGIRVSLHSYPERTFLAQVAGSPASVAADGLGLIVFAWSADFPAPSACLAPLVDSADIRAEGSPNPAGLRDADTDRAVAAAERTLDPAAAAVAWRQVATAAMRTAGYAPLVEDRVLLIGSAQLRNVYVQPAYRGYDVTSLGIR